MRQNDKIWDAIVRGYYGEDREDSHASYRGNLHSVDRDAPTVEGEIEEFLRSLPDRSQVRIRITVAPEPRTDLPRWILLERHFYGPAQGPVNWPRETPYFSAACLKGQHDECDGNATYYRDTWSGRSKPGPCKCEHHRRPNNGRDPEKFKQ